MCTELIDRSQGFETISWEGKTGEYEQIKATECMVDSCSTGDNNHRGKACVGEGSTKACECMCCERNHQVPCQLFVVQLLPNDGIKQENQQRGNKI